MKDAKGHGSDSKGAAHQAGVEQATAPGPRYSNDVHDAYRGDVYGSILAHDQGGAQIGHLDYSAGFDGGVHKTRVQMIATHPSARRQGVATGMANHLKQEFPGTHIKWGGRTPEGSAFIKGYYQGKRK